MPGSWLSTFGFTATDEKFFLKSPYSLSKFIVFILIAKLVYSNGKYWKKNTNLFLRGTMETMEITKFTVLFKDIKYV